MSDKTLRPVSISDGEATETLNCHFYCEEIMKTKNSKNLSQKEKTEIAELAACGKSGRQIGRTIGRDNKTVSKALREHGVILEKMEIEERLAMKFETLAESILDAVSEEDLTKASLQQKSISAATCLDKSRLLRNQSTSNQSVFFHIVAESCKDPGNAEEVEQ